jgi:hypothetical protein
MMTDELNGAGKCGQRHFEVASALKSGEGEMAGLQTENRSQSLPKTEMKF